MKDYRLYLEPPAPIDSSQLYSNAKTCVRSDDEQNVIAQNYKLITEEFRGKVMDTLDEDTSISQGKNSKISEN